MLSLSRRSKSLITATILALAIVTPLAAQQEPLRAKLQGVDAFAQPQPAAQREQTQTTIFKLQNLPASELASSLARSLGSRGIQIEAEPTTNSLLITATADNTAKASTLLQALDLPPSMINIDVSLVELSGDQGAITEAIRMAGSSQMVADLIKSGKLRVLNRVRVSALDNSQAHVRSQEQKAVPSARVFAGSRTGVRTMAQGFEERQTETTVSVRPKLSGSEISLDLQVESTRLENTPEVSAASENDAAASPLRTLTTSIQTTVRVPQGRSVLIQAATRQDGDSSRQFAVLVNATIGTPPAKPEVAQREELDPNNTTVVIYLRNAVAAEAKKVVLEVYRDHADKLNITADERTNALFIRGDGVTIQLVEELLKVLDTVDPKVKPEVRIQEFKKAIERALTRQPKLEKSNE